MISSIKSGSLLLLSLWLLLLLWLFTGSRLRRISLRVDGFSNLHRGVLQSLEGFLNLFIVLSNDALVKGSDVSVNLILDVLWDLGGMLLKLLLSVVDSLISLVLKVDHLSSGLICIFTSFSILHHLFDIGVTKSSA